MSYVTGCINNDYGHYYFETLSIPLGANRVSVFPTNDVQKDKICSMCIKNKGSQIKSGPSDFCRVSVRQPSTHCPGKDTSQRAFPLLRNTTQ